MKEKLKVNNDESGNRKYRLVPPSNGDNETHTLRSTKKYVRKLLSKKSTLEIPERNQVPNSKSKKKFEH